MLISTSFRRVVSPPAASQSSSLAARRSPRKKSSSHLPVKSAGKARLIRKQRGLPPIAATSLTARARHFHPTASAGCFPRRKCDPSRNQSQVSTTSRPRVGTQSAASSPIPNASELPPRRRPFRKALIFSINSFSCALIFVCHPPSPRLNPVLRASGQFSRAVLKYKKYRVDDKPYKF